MAVQAGGMAVQAGGTAADGVTVGGGMTTFAGPNAIGMTTFVGPRSGSAIGKQRVAKKAVTVPQ